jgi:predicted AlkP superfamily phosphohydrolase/phosphomutase
MTRTLVIGLDGCSWNVLEPLLDSGELPALAAIVKRGASGVLESTIPFSTGPAWASLATGASPAAHGIYDLAMPDEHDVLRPATRKDMRVPTYYERLGREGRRSVLINFPIDQGGCEGAVIVNSWVTDDDARRILPVGRRVRYRRLLESYSVVPKDPRDLEELCRLEEARFDLARELFLSEQWDHFYVLFSSPDWLSHMALGRFLSGKQDGREAFLKLYRQLDRYIGWLVDHAPDALVFVLSAHGQREEVAILRSNMILRDLGLAALRPRKALPNRDGTAAPAARATIRVPGALSRYRGNSRLRPLALATKKAARRSLSIELTGSSYAVDRSASGAYVPTDAAFAVYASRRDTRELALLADALRAAKLEDGSNAVDGVWTPEELYGRRDPDGPALLFAPAPGVRPSAAVKDRVIDFPADRGRGCHDRDGIFILAGPGVRASAGGRASIYDVAPTLLWSSGVAVPSDADGGVLLEHFDELLVRRRPVRLATAGGLGSRALSTEPAEVLHRLEKLGYI